MWDFIDGMYQCINVSSRGSLFVGEDQISSGHVQFEVSNRYASGGVQQAAKNSRLKS